MKYVYKHLAQFPKKQKATRIRIEHYLGQHLHMQVVFYGVDVPAALRRYKNFLELKIGYLKITALYGESRICELDLRVNELLDHYAAADLLLY